MRVLLLVLLLCSACSADPNSWYVDDANGSDAAEGDSWAEAWKTIPYTWSSGRGDSNDQTIAEGDTVYFKDGDYGAFREHTDDGSGYLAYRSSYINYVAQPGHSPAFSSVAIDNEDKWGATIDGGEGDAWTAGSGDTVTKDTAVYYAGAASIKIVTTDDRSDGDLLAYLNITPISLVGRDDEGFFYVRSDANQNADLIEVAICEDADGAKTGTYAVLLSPVLSADTWAYKTTVVDLSAFNEVESLGIYANGPIASGVTIYVDAIKNVGDGQSYISIDGFTIDSGVALTQTEYVKILNCTVQAPATGYSGYYAPYPVHDSRAIGANAASYLTITGNTVSNSYRGINVNSNSTVSDNTISNIGEDAINISGNSVTVSGNTITAIDLHKAVIKFSGTETGTFNTGQTVTQAGTGATGVVYEPAGAVSDPYELGLLQTSLASFATAANGGGDITEDVGDGKLADIDAIGRQHNDAVQVDGNYSSLTISNNLVTIEDYPATQGLKLACANGGALTDIVVENNLFEADTPATIHGVAGSSKFNNNTFIGADGTQFHDGGGKTPTYTVAEMYNNIMTGLHLQSGTITFTAHGNNIYGNDPNGDLGFVVDLATETTSADIDALFTDEASDDYTLVEGSIAINAGDDTYAPVTDILGNSRVGIADIGAYEYQRLIRHLFGFHE